MSYGPDYSAGRAAAVAWARALLARSDVVILDTETTGLGASAEVVQIAIISTSGQVLVDSLVKPTRPIPPDASAIHHITDAMVSDAPSWADILMEIQTAIVGTEVVIYNAAYDLGVIRHCCELAGRSIGLIGNFAAYSCAMEQYAAYVGDWSDYHGNYRYQKLPGGDHSALGDARATLRLIQRMAGVCAEAALLAAVEQMEKAKGDHDHTDNQ